MKVLEKQTRGVTEEDIAYAQNLFAQLQEASSQPKVPSEEKTDRGYVDGCYDLCHSGHFNCLRQAADVVDTLIIGPNSDADILATKGPTILNGQERADILRSLKWGH